MYVHTHKSTAQHNRYTQWKNKITMKQILYITIGIIVVSCSNDTKTMKEFASNESGKIKSESLHELHEKLIDSTNLIGEWTILKMDESVVDNPSVKNMPKSFRIENLTQLQNGGLIARNNHVDYNFSINKIDHDSLILYLHPGACYCEGLEVRYRKNQ